MKESLAAHSIVVINTGISPKLFNSFWLVNNGILKEEELNGDHVFTSQIVEINTDRFTLTISGNSFQISAKNGIDNLDFCVENVLVPLIDATPQAIHISSGLNFNWFVSPDDNDFQKLSKTLFFNESNDLYKFFDKGDAFYGAYFSSDVLESRLKLDVKPVFLSNPVQEAKGTIHFNFNFHYDIPSNNRNENLKNYVNRWEQYFNESEKIIDVLK